LASRATTASSIERATAPNSVVAPRTGITTTGDSQPRELQTPILGGDVNGRDRVQMFQRRLHFLLVVWVLTDVLFDQQHRFGVQRFAKIERNLVDGKITTPKSGKARRVDLSMQLTEMLRVLLVECKKETLRRGWGETPAWVFINESGNPVDPDNFRKRVWPKILTKAGLRQIRIRDLRHTYASLLIHHPRDRGHVRASGARRQPGRSRPARRPGRRNQPQAPRNPRQGGAGVTTLTI